MPLVLKITLSGYATLSHKSAVFLNLSFYKKCDFYVIILQSVVVLLNGIFLILLCT